jgi:endoglucanase
MSAARLVAVLIAACAALSGCGLGQDGDAAAAARPASRANPLAGQTLYVDPEGAAVRQVAAWKRENRQIDAARLQRLAGQPVATWFAGQQRNPFEAVRELTEPAARKGQVPVLVLYDIPDRDCGLFSKGGAADVDAYLSWVGSLAAGLEGRRAVIVLEPDAIAQAIDGCAGRDVAQERYRMLAQAVQILKRQEGAAVYLDAGNATWVEDLDTMANALRASGIGRADGFALNVSNFQTTEASTEYGHRLSDRLGGAHFVIDTGRNGAGVPKEAATAKGRHPSWCNPPGARLGQPPTTSTGRDRVDALLWIKQPGNSDGDCRPGAPLAGQWWPHYALELVG